MFTPHREPERFLINFQHILKPIIVDIKDTAWPLPKKVQGRKETELHQNKKLVYQSTLSAKSEKATPRVGETIYKSSIW